MNRNRLLAISLAAALSVGAAAYVRHRVVSSPGYRLSRALSDPRAVRLTSEIDRLQAEIARTPGDTAPRWKLADIFQKLGLISEAREQVAQITKSDPKSSAAALAVADIDMALRRDKDAEAEYRQVIAKWPKLVAGWQGLAALLFRQERYTESLMAIDQALLLDPKSENSKFILASGLLSYAREYPSPDMYAPYARLARKELESLLPVWPDPAEIHFRLGSAFSILRSNKDAIAHFDKAAQMQPKRADFALALADAYVAAGKRAEARQTVDAAIARGVRSALLLDRQGQLLQSGTASDDLKAAIAAYRQALVLQPNAEPIHEHLGSALVRAGKLDEARQEFEQAVRLNPQLSFPYQQLAAIYTRLGSTARATAAAQMATRMVYNEQQLLHYERLSAAYPTDLNLHLLLADRYRDLGKTSAARDKYLLVLRMDPKNKRAKQAIDGLNAAGATNVADR